MLRLLGFSAVAAALVILPASHGLLAKGPKERVTICHIDDDPVPGAGHLITVAEPAVPSHEAHGDCAIWIDQDFLGGTSDCSCEDLPLP